MRTQKKKLYVFFDTETYKDTALEAKGEFCEKSYVVGWIEVEDIEKYDHTKISFQHDWIYRKSDDKKPFKKFFERLCELRKKYVLVLVAHNIYFDIVRLFNKNFFEQHYGKIHRKLNVKTFKRGKFLLSGSIVSSRFSCRFFDTCKFITQSLENYLEELDVGIKKKELEDILKYNIFILSPRKISYLDENKKLKIMNVPQELDYLKSDVIGLPYIYKYIKNFKEKAIEKQGIDFRYHRRILSSGTLPALGKNLLNAHLKGKFDCYFRPLASTEKEYDKSEKSLFGGVRFYNKDFLKYKTKDEKILAYDVNSMFPYIMTKILPIGAPYKKPHKKWKKTVIFIETKMSEKLEWIDALSFMSSDILPYRLLLNEKGKAKTFYLSKDFFDLVNKISKTKLPVIKYLYFEGSQELKSWILKNHKLKEKSKTNFERKVYKLILNSIYGKMGEKPLFADICLNENMELSMKKKPQLSKRLRFTACYVINCAIAIIIKTILKEIKNGNVVLYGSVDSLIIANLSGKTSLKIDEKKLGGWRCEGKYNYFASLGVCMKYLLFNKAYECKMAFSGIPSKWKKMLLQLPAGTLKDIFSTNNNFIFRNVKATSKKYGLERVDFETNNGAKANYEIFADGKINKLSNLSK